MLMDQDAILQCVPGLSLATEVSVERIRQALYADPNSERIRWWQAYMDPTYDDRKANPQTASGRDKWLRTEVEVPQYRAVIRHGRVSGKYEWCGDLQDTDITLTVMPDEIAIGDHDLIMPIGRLDSGTPGPDMRTLEEKTVLVRGEIAELQDGTVSSASTTVTGVGTSFTSLLEAGDIVQAAGVPLRVSAVASDTSLTLESAPSPAWNTNQWYRCIEKTPHAFVAQITGIRDGSTTYTEGEHFALDTDEQTIRWLSATESPAPGARYSIIYRFQPRYIIQYDLGVRPHVVRGKELLRSMVARLYTQGDLRR